MFKSDISIQLQESGRVAYVVSALAHCLCGIFLFTSVPPPQIGRQVRSMPIIRKLALPPMETPVKPAKRVVSDKAVMGSRLARFRPNLNDGERALPEACALILPAAPAVVPPLEPKLPELRPPSTPLINVASPKLEVRTGSFESGLKAASRAGNNGVKPQVPGFDSPILRGNGGTTGLVAATDGFGDGANPIAARVQRGEIVVAQFDAVQAKPKTRSSPMTAGPEIRSPLEITFKPRPAYTEEARRLRIEGEVVLEVMFRASSETCVLRVIHGLGYGLDETAISAASAIRFRPATEGGRPIDHMAAVKITFQIAD